MHRLRHAFRGLLLDRGFTLLAILSLGLGIGADTAIFTIVDAILLQQLPVRDPDTLYNVYTRDSVNNVGQRIPVSVPNFEDLREGTEQFEQLVAVANAGATLVTEAELAQQVPLHMVTGNYFGTLGVEATAGRLIAPADDIAEGAAPVVVVSHGLAQRILDGDNAVGSTVELNGTPFTVIGIAPLGFKGISTLGTSDRAWIPLSMRGSILPPEIEFFFQERRALPLTVFGRLAEGATEASAAAEMRSLAASLAEAFPDANSTRTLEIVPTETAAVGINQRDGLLRSSALLLAVVTIVLAIACANVANLSLVRADRRVRELSVRAAMGASRAELMKLSLTEAALLGAAGGAVGLLIAWLGTDLLWALRPTGLPADAADPVVNFRVMGFAAAVAMVTSLVFGAVPALRAARPDVQNVLRTSGRGGSVAGDRLRSLLVAGEIGLAMLGLVGAGLFIRSLQLAQEADTGFEMQRLGVMSVGFGLGYTFDDQDSYRLRALDQVRAIPAVEQAAFATAFPLSGVAPRTLLPEEADPDEGGGMFSGTVAITPGYFEVLGIPILRGRAVENTDVADAAAVAVVNETAAERYWPDQEVLGRRFQFYGDPVMRTVVGVVPDVTVSGIGSDPEPVVYMPAPQWPLGFAVLHVRTRTAPANVLPQVRDVLQEIDRELAVQNVQTIEEVTRSSLWARRTAAGLLSLFAGLALVLSAIGVYGVLAYAQRQRRLEIGIRMALGESTRRILGLLLRQGLMLAACGILLGAGAAAAIGRLVSGMLYGIGVVDAPTYLVTAVILMGVAALASLLPALRATRTSPLIVMREQ